MLSDFDDTVTAEQYLAQHPYSVREPDGREPSTHIRALIETRSQRPRQGISPEDIRSAMEEDVARGGLNEGCYRR